MMDLREYLDEEVVEIVMKKYAEPHRYFHTFDHVKSILDRLSDYYNEEEKEILIIAAVFHDIVYDPTRNDNEEKSVELMKELIGNSFKKDFINKVSQIILDTKIVYSENTLSRIFNLADRAILNVGNVSQLIEYGNKIWKEYSFHSYKKFLEGHFSIIDSFSFEINKANLNAYKQYMKSRKIRLAIYPGSFNPFHKGYEYIVKEANKLFDKVVIAKGMNPNKTDVISEFKINKIENPNMKFYETVEFSGLLSDLVNHYESEGYDVTIVKGIRNYQDLDSEMSQRKFLNDIKQDLKYVFIPCSEEFNYISSSAIRSLQKFGKDVSKYVA